MREFDDSGVTGLPGPLPSGERIVWQGSPDWLVLARTAFKVRWIAAYFALLVLWGLATGAFVGAAITVGAGIGCVALLHLLAWLTARATVYTVTDRRIVLRIGVALPMCINVPMPAVETARLALGANGSGDIALKLNARQRAGYLMLWPYARAWAFASPEPTLRAITEAQTVATLLARTMASAVPGGRRVLPSERGEAQPIPNAAAAA